MPERIDFDQVVVDGVSRAYGRRRALRQVSVTCRVGEVVGLLGPNGAGKSTLMSILGTLAEPSSGEVRYGSWTARAAGGALRGRIGFLSHELQLYPELTARENLEFFAGLYGLGEAARRVGAALETASLTGRADDLVDGFSRGMRQRLALERVLLHDPRLVLLDEPFTGLDESACGELVARLRSLREAGRIVVLTTHDLDLVDGLLDQEVVLRAGRVTPPGAGASLRERYRAAVLADTARRGRTEAGG